VWRVKKEKPTPQPIEYGIRYIVIPEENYKNENGFMTVEYKTSEEVSNELEERFSNGKISQKVFEKRLSKIPKVGRIKITLGRENINNAISRWFIFTCIYNDEIIFNKHGIEDIPYVYGGDRLWWNDKSYNVNEPWDGELKLNVKDNYQDKVYRFKIIKERYPLNKYESDTTPQVAG
ncbi:MAG: hypothetical protein PQJ46_00245, partial [Spirochaetales bacterium]|nr:hypothetical protein [Spirochaetales bacterium]